MKNTAILKKMIQQASSGLVYTRQATKKGIHRSAFTPFLESGDLYRASRGIYVRADVLEDDFLLLQNRWQKAIFSHETALYLLGFSDRTPKRYTVTLPKGYNAQALFQENVEVKRVTHYDLGKETILSPYKNPIQCYGIERTLCDIVRGKGIDITLVNEAMKRYLHLRTRNIHQLMEFASVLRVKPKVMRYLEVLL